MPRIGFEDDLVTPEVDEVEIDKRLEEIKRQPQEEREVITLSKRTLERIQRDHSEVVVNDYGDGYHKTVDELTSENDLFKTYSLISGKKTKYRKLDEYIVACRNCLAFLTAVSERQTTYPPEEFRRLWGKGKIKINGMYLPEYTGKDRKRLSKGAVAEYVLSDAPPKEFLETNNDAPVIDSIESMHNELNLLFTQDELEYIFSDPFDEEDIEDDCMIDPDVPKTFINKPVAITMDKKYQKHLMKDNSGFAMVVKDAITGNRIANNYSSDMIYNMQEDDLDAISKYDQTYNYRSKGEAPTFTGSFLKKSDYEDYMESMREWEWNHTTVNYNNRPRTLEEVNDLRIRETLEREGWNVRLFWNNPEKEEKLKKMLKNERKKEQKLREQLSLIEDRRSKSKSKNRQMRDAFAKDEKKRKKFQKKKRKKSDLSKTVSKKRQMLDDVLLGTVDTNLSYKKYKGEALDWSWDKITGGK